MEATPSTDEYIAVQRRINSYHSNGMPESEYEEALGDFDFLARWVKRSGLPCDSFLDLGCRIGYVLDRAVHHFPAARVMGLDIVPEFVEVANRRCDAVQGDMQALPFADRSYDWTFSVASIEHCPDAQAAANEMKRVANVGCYVQTDLEDKARFDKNASHFTYHNNPMEWAALFASPDWWLVRLDVPRYSRVSMLWVRSEYMNDWNKDADTWRAE